MVAMVVDRREIPESHRCFGVIVPSVEKRKALAISFPVKKYPGRVASEQTLLRVFLGGAAAPELVEASDQELFSLAWREVQELIGVRTMPSRIMCSVGGWLCPQYHVGI